MDSKKSGDRLMSEEQEEKRPLRRVFVLKSVEVDFDDLKKGDIFRLGKATIDDPVNEDQYYLAKSDAKPKTLEEEKVELSANQINFVETVALDELRLDKMPESFQDIYDQLKQAKGDNNDRTGRNGSDI